MRVLVAHNLYRSATPSGENQLVRAEIALLRDHGVDVVEMLADSDEIAGGLRGVLQAAPGPVYSRAGVRRFTGLLDETRPDVVHLHNVFPLISPWVARVARRRGVPVVQTVHNYRHGCVNGLHLRDGHPCTDCLGTRLGLPAVRHGCYRDSRLQTVPMTIGQAVHRGTWRDDVAGYFVLTPFMRDKLVVTGVPDDRIHVRPTWVPDPGPVQALGRDVLFVGRLDEAKGVDRLLDAWSRGGRDSGRDLVIVGDGPLSPRVEAAQTTDPRIRWVGRRSPAEVISAMDAAAYVVVPSRVFEGFPLVVAEAYARGRAVLTVSGGSVGSIVTNGVGWITEPTTEALTTALRLIEDDEAASLSAPARAHYEEQCTPQAALRSLMHVYLRLTAHDI
jgi:glycosyltransferase involved in cell wall biosynthesis